MSSNVSGILICVVCGIVDAICFVALGGTFAGLMTGNLILMGVSLGGLSSDVQAAVFLYPLIGYSLGAVLAGVMFKIRGLDGSCHRGLWLAWWMLAAATLVVWVMPVKAGSAAGWLVVALSALYMGFQSAVLYLAKRVTITTNVMTSTLTSFLADYPMQVGRGGVGWQKFFALLGFLLGVVIGAWSVTTDIRFAFSLALALATLAIAGLNRQTGNSTTK
jgi:uncharacterized membrane protein YoaK (UPF0700 family)